MNKHFKKVLSVLKTKGKQLGFSYQELKGVAAKIADNLELEDDASDEDVASAVENAVDDAMEFLSVSQSAAQRAIANYKAKHNISDDDDDDDDDDGADGGAGDDDTSNDGGGKKKKGRQNRGSKSDEDSDDDGQEKTPAWAKSLTDAITALGNKVSSLEQGKVADGRRVKLQGLLKDTGKFGERKLKEFNRIADTFKSEQEFDEYFDEVSEDLDEYNQERADIGLSKLGKPGAGSPGNKGGEDADKPKELTDEELDAIADQL